MYGALRHSLTALRRPHNPATSHTAASTIARVLAAGMTRRHLTSVYFGNLDWSINEDELQELVSRYSPGSLRLPRDQLGRTRGFGFVDFEDDAVAEQAISELNGINFRGRMIRVSKAEGRKEAPGNRDYSYGNREYNDGRRGYAQDRYNEPRSGGSYDQGQGPQT